MCIRKKTRPQTFFKKWLNRKRKENRAREENKEMFQDSNKNKREHIPLIGAVLNYLLTKISWKPLSAFETIKCTLPISETLAINRFNCI